MRLLTISLSMALVLLTAAAPARAQDRRPFGVTIAFPGPIGVVWQPVERVAVRATVSFASNGVEEIGDGDSDGFSLGTSVSGLFYLQLSGPFRIYLSPRYSYSRSSSTSSIEVPSLSPPVTITTVTVSTESKNRSHGGAGLVGVEYRLGERFAVFGEAGLQVQPLEELVHEERRLAPFHSFTVRAVDIRLDGWCRGQCVFLEGVDRNRCECSMHNAHVISQRAGASCGREAD